MPNGGKIMLMIAGTHHWPLWSWEGVGEWTGTRGNAKSMGRSDWRYLLYSKAPNNIYMTQVTFPPWGPRNILSHRHLVINQWVGALLLNQRELVNESVAISWCYICIPLGLTVSQQCGRQGTGFAWGLAADSWGFRRDQIEMRQDMRKMKET